MSASTAEDHELPQISVDIAFPGSVAGVGVTMLMTRERCTRMTCAVVFPRGATGALAASQLMAFLGECGAVRVRPMSS